jgi:hypothetical protein
MDLPRPLFQLAKGRRALPVQLGLTLSPTEFFSCGIPCMLVGSSLTRRV